MNILKKTINISPWGSLRGLVCGALFLFCICAAHAIDIVRADVHVDALHNGQSLVLKQAGFDALKGNGVVVGIIDAGFDYTHPAFYDPQRKTLRIKRVWEQYTKLEGASAPADFNYGIELTTPEEILAAGGDYEGNSHGNHVVATIAGADTTLYSKYIGIAPEADIVLVSKKEYERGNQNLLDAIKYIFDYAKSVGKPCVINMSLGHQAGPHDGTSIFDQTLTELQGEGLIIVGSAGNHNQEKFHIGWEFAGLNDTPLQTFIDYHSTPTASNTGGDIEIWGERGLDYQVNLVCYNTVSKSIAETRWVLENKADVNGLEYPDENSSKVQTFSFSKNITGKLLVASEVSPLNGKLHVVISSRVTNIRNNYALGIQIVPLTNGKINIWADGGKVGLTDKVQGKPQPGYMDADNDLTICEIGGTARDIISVGAYTTRNTYYLFNDSQEYSLSSETVGELSSFSSKGITPDGRVKPEVTAPGCLTISALSSNDNGAQMLAYAYQYNDKTYKYGYMQGTSMATPVVTGVVALMLQANPSLTPQQAKEILISTSRENIKKVDALAAVEKVVQTSGIAPIMQNTERGMQDSYNLAGQRVGKDYRGIVIKGGKKVLTP